MYNGDGMVRESDIFYPEKDTILYAVWAKGYVDLYDGDDYVYLFENNVAYLARGNVFFKGFYDAKTQMIIFGNKNGTAYDNNTFCYMNDGKTFYLNENGKIVETTNLILTGNTVEYSNQKTSEKSYGTFVRGEGVDCYVATFDRGPLKGQTLTIKTKVIDAEDENSNGVTKLVFSVRNEEHLALNGKSEEEGGLGGMIRVAFANGNLGTYYPVISLDGFGVAKFISPTNEQTYYYTLEDDFLSLSSNEGGAAALTARIVELNGLTVWVLYDETMDQTFTLDSGDTLELDGGIFATYTVDGTAKEGYYSTSESLFGTIVSFISGSDTHKFLIKEHKSDDPVAGGTGNNETYYTIESKAPNYAEYRYYAGGLDSTVHKAPLLILDDEQAGMATLYGVYVNEYDKDGKPTELSDYVKVSVGTYELNNDGYYVYNVTESFEIKDVEKLYLLDLTTIQSVIFKVDVTSTEYSLMTWKAYTTKGDPATTVEFEKEYTSADGYTLTLIGGFAILSKPEEESFVGAYYFTKEGLTVIVNGENARYVELGEDNTFVLLTEQPYSANLLTEKDEVNKMEYMTFDGKGNATYVKIITPAQGETPAVTEETQGTVEKIGVTSAGLKEGENGVAIYRFTANDNSMTFEYINVPDSKYIAKYNQTYNGWYLTDSEGLELDGFGHKARYTDAKGNLYYGLYNALDENVIVFYVEETDTTYYFDLKVEGTNKSFTVRGSEYGLSYLYVDNQRIEYWIDLDGYDTLTLFKELDKDGNPVAPVEVPYTYENGILTFTYNEGSDEVTVQARISTFEYNGEDHKAVIAIRSDVVRTYVNETDWSVLILDELGNAIKYTAEGKKITGSYVIVNEEFLYYVNDDLEDACVYTYSYDEQTKKATATPNKFENRSYYTEDFKRLLFYTYGYGYHGDVRFYYYENSDGNVVIYRYAKEGEEGNKYGFVADDTFGAFENDQNQPIKEKTYDNEPYYMSNGFGMSLTRVEATKDYYPIQLSNSDETKYALEKLTFNPGATEEYTSLASVVINGKTYEGYVVREKNDADEFELFLSIGYYRFHLDITYRGETSTYEVTKLEYVRSLYSHTYLEYYYWNALLFGTALKNDFGMVYICADYDTTGAMTGQYIKGEFLEGSNLKDSQGNIISFENAKYSYSSSKIYGAEFVAEDGLTYTLYFSVKYQSALGRYGYVVKALARHQTLETANGYSVTVERIIYTEEKNISVGMIYTVHLAQGETELKAESIFVANDKICYVVRERAASTVEGMLGNITSTTYYYIDLKEKAQGDSIEGGDKAVLDFESATVDSETMTTVYENGGMSWVDISSDKDVMLIVIVSGKTSSGYIIETSTYNEETKTYTCTTETGVTFTVVVNEGGTVTITSPETE